MKGTNTHYISLWKPYGSTRQRMNESFTGGIVHAPDANSLYKYLTKVCHYIPQGYNQLIFPVELMHTEHDNRNNWHFKSEN